MKHNITITSLDELENEECRVRLRIKKQETELALRVQKIPEEIVTTAIVKLVSGIIQGNGLKGLVNFAKKVGKNVLSNVFGQNR